MPVRHPVTLQGKKISRIRHDLSGRGGGRFLFLGNFSGIHAGTYPGVYTPGMGIEERFTKWNAISTGGKRLQHHYVVSFLQAHDWQTVTSEEVSLWIHREDWAANTRCAAHAAIKKFFHYVCDVLEEREDNPMKWLSRPRPRQGIPRPVPEDILRRVLGEVSDRDTALMLRLGALQGMRRAEIAGLRLTDVDFERGVILVRGKGDKVRSVPLHPEVRPLLEGRTGDYIFPGRGALAVPVSSRTVARKVSRALEGLFTTHQLRHRFASAVYQTSGHDLRLVQELLGHASVATTQIYTSVSTEAKESAVAGI